MTNEQLTLQAHKMYECRRTLRRLFSSNYQGQVKPYMAGIVKYVAQHDCSVLSATTDLGHRCLEGGYDNAVIWLLAACVELIEPDEESPVIVDLGE